MTVGSVKRRAMAYITHGEQLLVFRHVNDPEAGIQVPGGTVEPDEQPVDAVLREAFEETGLEGLRLGAFLGEAEFDLTPYGRDGIQHRFYYHVTADGPVPEVWQHIERDPSEGDEEEILFECYWVELPEGVPELIASMDEKLPELLAMMGLGE